MDKGTASSTTTHTTRLAAPAAIALALTVFANSSTSAATVSFSGGVPSVTQYQSDGVTPIPTDGSFLFEVGSFGDFVPTTLNHEEWLAHWTPVTDPAGDPLPGATTEFTTLSFDFGGFSVPYDGYASSVDLEHNNTPFSSGTQGYVWGFDNRDQPGDAQWILMTGSDWKYPTHSNAPTSTWTVGNADTTYIGTITNNNQMTLGAVTIPNAVPEPSSAMLVGLASFALALSRRRRQNPR